MLIHSVDSLENLRPQLLQKSVINIGIIEKGEFKWKLATNWCLFKMPC